MPITSHSRDHFWPSRGHFWAMVLLSEDVRVELHCFIKRKERKVLIVPLNTYLTVWQMYKYTNTIYVTLVGTEPATFGLPASLNALPLGHTRHICQKEDSYGENLPGSELPTFRLALFFKKKIYWCYINIRIYPRISGYSDIPFCSSLFVIHPSTFPVFLNTHHSECSFEIPMSPRCGLHHLSFYLCALIFISDKISAGNIAGRQ